MYTTTHRTRRSSSALAARDAGTTRRRACSTAVTSCRGRTGATQAYAQGHIPGRDAGAPRSRPVGPDRRPRPGGIPCLDVDELRGNARHAGASTTDVQVVAYDQGNGAYAARRGGCCAGCGTRARRGARWRIRGVAGSGPAGDHANRARALPRQFAALVPSNAMSLSRRPSCSRRSRSTKHRARSTRAARIASPARTKPSIPSPATFPARAIARSRRTWTPRPLPRAAASCGAHWSPSARRPRRRRTSSRCAAPASPPATTCSRWRSRDCPARASTPAPGASGSATRAARSRASNTFIRQRIFDIVRAPSTSPGAE